MNRRIIEATMSAVAFAGATALGLLWLASRRRHWPRADPHRDLQAHLSSWDGEGGTLATAPSVEPAIAR